MEPSEKAKPLSLLLVDDDVELCSMMKEFLGRQAAGWSARITAGTEWRAR